VIPSVTIGASYGAAYLAALSVADVSITEWNPAAEIREPNESLRASYDELYELYLALYPASRSIAHALAERERSLAG
jgi:xylulokinase